MDPQVNYSDDDDGDDNNNSLPQNLDANGFEIFANQNDFDFNTKTLHELLCHIVNGNPILYDFTIVKNYDIRVANGNLLTAILNNTRNCHHCAHFKERGPHVNKKPTETAMNVTLVTNLAPTLILKLSVITKPQTT